MPLAPGTWLSHYEILGHLGSGGMGDVYRARDNKLQREVALKVLPPHFANDPERIARFRREAQLLAQLNHPNIAILYNFEETGETRFLVMELVLGETLRERIKRGSLPLEESLDICSQITEALEHAHEKPIIHRDLKPANVKVTPQGQVKVLDFGLAKAFGADTANVDPHDAPTGSLAGTLKGTILGTPAYMSPEQARGKETDKRTDIWALGCVLYELLTGKWAFQSRDREGAEVPLDTVQDIIAKVLEREPDWTALPETTPPGVRSLLRRCLEKDLKRRSRDAAEIRFQIEEAEGAPVAIAPAPPVIAAVPRPPLWRRAVPLHLVALVAIGALIAAGLAVWNLKPAPARAPRPVSRTVVALPPNEQLAVSNLRILALSPDGAQLAYVASEKGATQQLYLRRMDSDEAKPISGTEGATGPFFSPDGQWVGFFANGKLKKAAVSGGATLTLCDAPDPRGATWGPNDTIVFTPTLGDGLWKVSAAGGAPQKLTTLKEGEPSHRWPQFLPDGKSILFTVTAGASFDEFQIAVQRLDTGDRKVLLQGGVDARYVPTGHLVYYRAGTLMAVPFDPVRLEVMGTPVPALEGVTSQGRNAPAGQFSFSGQGSLVYIAGEAQGRDRTLVWVDRKGAVQPLPAAPGPYVYPKLSPDGRQVAFSFAAGKSDIWIYDLVRDTRTRLTFEGSNDDPNWTPDGKRVVFFSNRGRGTSGLFWKAADGSGPEERLTTSELNQGDVSFAPDGRTFVYSEANLKTTRDLWVLPLEGDARQPAPDNRGAGGEARKPRVLLQTPFDERSPRLSPDGRWLAYASNESGRFEVYVRPFPGPGGKWQISTEGGEELAWSPKGNELFYRTGSQKERMMAVEVQTRPAFSAGKPRLLFEGTYIASPIPPAYYSVSPDAQRFLMLKAKDQPEVAQNQIHVVLNWFEELKRRVPTGTNR